MAAEERQVAVPQVAVLQVARAERVARSIAVPVVSVSEDQQVIAVYVGDEKHPLEAIPRLLNRANQALSTLERYKNRLDAVSGEVSHLTEHVVGTLAAEEIAAHIGIGRVNGHVLG